MTVDMHVHTPRPLGDKGFEELVPAMGDMICFGRDAGIDRFVLLSMDYGADADDALARRTAAVGAPQGAPCAHAAH